MIKTVKSFHDLVAWQGAMELVTEIYKVSQPFPKEEMFGLMSQISRAAFLFPAMNLRTGTQDPEFKPKTQNMD
jgi:four helix bundle protein